jgi:hypothetical protein
MNKTKVAGAFLLLSVFVGACAKIYPQSEVVALGKSAILQCEKFIQDQVGLDLAVNIDRAYVDVFEKGLVVALTEGAVGTFEKRDSYYRQHWACAFSMGKLVKVSAPLEEPLLHTLGYEKFEKFENYDNNTKELLFKRSDKEYTFYREQVFNSNNIEKHNSEN